MSCSSGLTQSRPSQDVSECDVVITLFFQAPASVGMSFTSRQILLHLGFLFLVQIIHVHDKHHRTCDAHDKETQNDGIALDVAWGICEDMRSHDREALSENFSHGPSGASLGESGGVDAEPGHEENHARIEARGDQAGGEDLGRNRVDTKDNDVSDAGHGQGENEERSFHVVSIGKEANGQHDDCRAGVGDDGEQLRSLCSHALQSVSAVCQNRTPVTYLESIRRI